MKTSKSAATSLLLTVLVIGCSKPAQEPVPAKPSAVTPESAVTPGQAIGDLRISPSTLKSNQRATVSLELKDPAGKSIPGAEVKVILTMPMGQSQMKDEAPLKWDGSSRYTGSIKPPMAGTWDVAVEARREGKLLLSIPSSLEVK